MSADPRKSVFINCPFDEKYLLLFRPLVFTVLGLGLHPRFALERADSAEVRISKIIRLIRESSFGVHDLSRCKAGKKGEYYRMNMPLELGYDLGAKAFGGRKLKGKKVLILEETEHMTKRAASDLAGCDCFAHGNDPRRIVVVLRNWLVQEAGAHGVAAERIWSAFNDFMSWNFDDLTSQGWAEADVDRIEMDEMRSRMVKWLSAHPFV